MINAGSKVCEELASASTVVVPLAATQLPGWLLLGVYRLWDAANGDG